MAAAQASVRTVSGALEIDSISSHSTCRFEDALNVTGFGKYNVYMTMLSSLISMAIIVDNTGFSYILPASQCDFELTLTQKGWLGAIPLIGAMISSYFWGYLADTRGRKRTIITSMSLGLICAIISSFSPTLPIFAVLRFSSSAFLAGASAVIHPYCGEFMPKKYVGSMLSILSTTMFLGTTVSTLIAWGVLSLDFRIPIDFLGIEYKPWRLVIICYALLLFPTVLFMLKASESPKFLMSQGKNEETLKILQIMYAINTGNNKSSFPVKHLILDEIEILSVKSKDDSFWHSIIEQTVPLFRQPLVLYVLNIGILYFGMFTCTISFTLWLPDIIDRYYVGLEIVDDVDNKNFCELMGVRSELKRNNTLMMNTLETSDICVDDLETNTYTLMIILSCVRAVGNLILAGVLHITSKKVVLLTILSLECLSCFSFEWAYNKVWELIVIFLIHMNGILIGVVNAYGLELIPSKHRSMAICLIMMIGRIGSVTGTNLIGYLIETNCPANFYAFGGLFLVCLICSVLLPTIKRPDKKISGEES